MFLTPTIIGDLSILAILGLMVGHWRHLKSTNRWLLLDPLNTFWIGILVCYVGQPLLGGSLFVSWHSATVFDKTLLATVLGLVFVVVGYENLSGLRLAQQLPRLPATLSSDKLLFAALALVGLGFVGYYYVINLSGGLEQWLSVGRGATDYEKVQGYLPELAQALPAGASLLLLRAGLFRISSLDKLFAWSAGALMWWWFLYLGSRSRLIMFTIIMIAAFYLPRRKSPHLAMAGALVLLLYSVLNFQTYYREQFTNLSFNFNSINKGEMWGLILPVYLGGNLEMQRALITPGTEFNCALSVVDLVPNKVPYNYGYGFLEIVTRPIPRRIWPDKRYPHMESVQGVLRQGGLSETTVEVAKNQELLMGPSFGFVGHWYYVGGFVGVIIGGIVTGILLRFIRGMFELNPKNQGVIVVYPFLLSIGFAEAASTPWYWFYTLPFVLLPFLAIIYFARELPRAPRRRSGSRTPAVVANQRGPSSASRPA